MQQLPRNAALANECRNVHYAAVGRVADLSLRCQRWVRHDAAKESNLPSRGLPGPASFEGRVGRLETPHSYWVSRFGGMEKGMTGHS